MDRFPVPEEGGAPLNAPAERTVRLVDYDNAWFFRGRSRWQEAAWLFVQALLVSSWIPGARHRVVLLRLFGAKIGKGVDIKPGVKVKFPWRLVVGDHSWIGEGVWIDNLAPVSIGSNCCISQGTYLCTGSHDWSKSAYDLMVKPITIHDSAWLAAQTRVAPGVEVGEGAVLAIGSIALADLEPWAIYRGAPAVKIRERELRG